MGLFRKGKEKKRRFQMREKMMSIGDDYWIEDDAGDKAFKVDGKAMRMRDTWVLEDAQGNEVAKIREKKLSIRDTITIESSAVAKPPSRRRWSASVTGSSSRSTAARI